MDGSYVDVQYLKALQTAFSCVLDEFSRSQDRKLLLIPHTINHQLKG